MTLLSRASRALGWSRQEWLLVIEAWLALLVARVAVRFLRLPDILRRIERGARFRAAATDESLLVLAVWRGAALHALPMVCLPRSLALAWMMARRGQPCTVVIGAQPRNGTLDAHAWIEQDGIPINSPLDSAETFPVLLRHEM